MKVNMKVSIGVSSICTTAVCLLCGSVVMGHYRSSFSLLAMDADRLSAKTY